MPMAVGQRFLAVPGASAGVRRLLTGDDDAMQPTEPFADPAAEHSTQASPDVVLARPAGSPDRYAAEQEGAALTNLVEQPAKVMRIGSMVKHLLEEVRAAPLDEASRQRLKEVHASSIRELEAGLAPELRDELERLTLPFDETATPTDAELRIAQAQLVGWLEGLFHGIQTALFAQQMAARAQLEEMRRRALPAGSGMPRPPEGVSGPYL